MNYDKLFNGLIFFLLVCRGSNTGPYVWEASTELCLLPETLALKSYPEF